MKKLSVLLIAIAVALGASAGVNQKITNTNTKVSVKELKAKAGQHQTAKYTRGAEAIMGTPLKATDWQVRPASHMVKGANDIVWDFEDADQLVDWTILDNDGDGYCWQYFNNAGLESGRMTAHSGDGLVASASYDNDTFTALTPDNWLISPLVVLGKSLSFWACGQDASYAAEKFGVFVCIGQPTSINDFVQVGFDRTATGTMTQYAYDLSEYEGQEGCIAIRHYNVTDMFFLNVDDVTISDEEVIPEPEPETPTLITQIPENCEVYTYYRNSACTYISLFGIGQTVTDGKMSVAIDYENGEAYIQNPSWWHDGNGTWVKGTYDAETGYITIPTGQYLSWDDSYGYGIQLMWGSTYVYEEEGELYLGNALDERTTEIMFQKDGDNLYLLGCEGDMNAEFPENYNSMGLYTMYSDDLSMTALEFTNYDENGEMLPFGRLVNLVPAVPADPTADDWYDSGAENGYTRFNFTLPTEDVDGNPIDRENLSYSIYLDDDQIFTFDAMTYSYDISEDMTEIPYSVFNGGYDFGTSFVYFYRTNAEGYEPLFQDRIGIQVHYTVNGVKNSSNIVYYVAPVYEPAVPANPTDLTWSDCGDESGMSRFGFTLPTVDVDGNPIDQMCLSYSIYTDDDLLFVFDAETYSTDLTEDMTEIPYSIWNSGWDFYRGAVYFYRTNEGMNGEEPFFNHQIGIQVHYTIDGVKNSSDIVYLEVFDGSNVNEINTGKTVANVRYFNVAGQEMAQPSGMTIKVTTYTDGTTSTSKVVK